MSLTQVGEFKAHAAEWKANMRAELRETRRRLSVEIHDKLQRAATIRSMERRRLGLEQRAHSLDLLSPEKRAVFASFDRGRFKTTSQESIDTKLNNLRLKGEQYDKSSRQQASSEENIFNRFGSLTKLGKRNRNRNISEDTLRHRACEVLSSNSSNTTLAEERQNTGEQEGEEEEIMEKEENTAFTNLPPNAKQLQQQNGFVPAQAKERETDKILAEREHQP